MATGPYPADTKESLISVAVSRDSEAATYPCTRTPPSIPKWPRVIGAVCKSFVLLASISIIGILAHSLHNYSGTRGIHFGGTAISWPKNLNLHPAYLILANSAIGITPSLASIAINIHRSKALSWSRIEKTMASMTGILVTLWLIADILQGMSETRPKTDILSWACRRRESPTNILVSYTSICDEQRAIKYIAVLVTVAEAGSLAGCLTTWYFCKRRSKLIDEPWRIKR
ncbi:MAG: hypothetical protein Q9219_003223 [cf. Caloplaca sp. 3 TL-2023]